MDLLRKRADYIIDTSHLLTRELRQEIEKIFVNNEKFCNMMVTVLSFGFKYGIPADADWYSMCVFFRILIMSRHCVRSQVMTVPFRNMYEEWRRPKVS